MWVIVHTCSGLALGVLLGGWPLWILLPAALVLHALLDLVPHWDYTAQRRRVLWAALDLAASLMVVSAAIWLYHLPTAAWLAAIVSAAPDLDVLDALLPGTRRVRLFPSHFARYPHGKAAMAPGIAVQGVVAAISLLAVALAV
ncbi:MAG: hypothetical protein GXX83_06290 [Gaiellales bacterium]|nr:hypothetical protein [Gaiellales bacterium]